MTTEQPGPRQRIEVMPHGPYEVSGDVPLQPKTILRSDQGEALTWSAGEEVTHPQTYMLCRCGQSDNKPFCDGSHAFDLFNGTESASTNTSAERVEIHDGPDIRVLKDDELCQHAGFCNTVARSWFDMISDTDDREVKLQLIGMIERCPSGALVYEMDGEPIEQDLPVAVSPVTDGPLFVTGGIEIERVSGELLETRNRVALCRCGQSGNKPLCDGTHFDIDFKA